MTPEERAANGRLGAEIVNARTRKRLAKRDAAIAASKGSLREIGARFGVSYEIVRRIKDRLCPKRAA